MRHKRHLAGIRDIPEFQAHAGAALTHLKASTKIALNAYSTNITIIVKWTARLRNGTRHLGSTTARIEARIEYPTPHKVVKIPGISHNRLRRLIMSSFQRITPLTAK